MRFYTRTEERIGYDFYVDIAMRIVEARKIKGWTQKQLAKEMEWTESKVSRVELVQIKVRLDEIKKLAKHLEVTVNWLICAEVDSDSGECLYLVKPEHMKDFELYMKATSKRLAFLEVEKKLKIAGVRFLNPRERAVVRLVGVPISDSELRDRFPIKASDEDEEIEPD